MAVTFEEFDGVVVTGRGRAADELSVTLKAALLSSLEAGKPRVLKGLDETGRKTAKGRLPNMASSLGASLSIGYSAEGDLVLTARPKVVAGADEPTPVPAGPAQKPARPAKK